MPDIRGATNEFARKHPELARSELRKMVDELWSTDVFELRSAAIALLSRYITLLDERDLPWLLGFVRRSTTWAHVDWLASDVIGGVVGESKTALRRLPVWARDDNFWVRRTALLAQLRPLSHEAGDFRLFARIAAPMLGEREFFIRKAIGWVLREVSKKRPELVFEFLSEHREEVSGLTLSEGAKYLPAAQRRALRLTAKTAGRRRAGHPARRRPSALVEPSAGRGSAAVGRAGSVADATCLGGFGHESALVALEELERSMTRIAANGE
jgi:3-methyladenine DNA glycosylase AlkD